MRSPQCTQVKLSLVIVLLALASYDTPSPGIRLAVKTTRHRQAATFTREAQMGSGPDHYVGSSQIDNVSNRSGPFPAFRSPGWMLSVAYSPDGNLIASGSGDCGWRHDPTDRVTPGEVLVWDAATGRLIHRFPQWMSATSVAFSPDGRTIASGDEGQEVKLWEIKSGQLKRTIGPHNTLVDQVRFSPNGTFLASLMRSKLLLWDSKIGKLIRTIPVRSGDAAGASSVAFSPDSKRIASCVSDSGTVGIWDVMNGKLMMKLKGHREFVRCIAFSHDGETLVTGDAMGTVRLWNLRAGTVDWTFEQGEEEEVSSLDISFDDSILATSDRYLIHLWELRSRTHLRTLRWMNRYGNYSCYVKSIAFSPDGTKLASAHWDKTVRIWQVSTGRLLAVLVSMPKSRLDITSVNWLVLTPEGYFDASDGAFPFLKWKTNGAELIDMGSQNKVYFRADLVRKALRGERLPEPRLRHHD